MKNKNKTKSIIKKNSGIVISNPCINVEGKKDIELIRYHIDSLTEDEIRELLDSFSKEKKEIKAIYYSLNTPVAKIRKRTFTELTKKFFQRLSQTMNLKMQRMIKE